MTARKAPEEHLPDGRPPLYETPEQMQPVIDEYFKQCDKKKEPYTVEGLSYHLGFETRKRIWELPQVHPEFRNTLARAKLKIAANRMAGGLSKQQEAKVVIFDFLNNHEGYKDVKQFEIQGQIEHAHMIGPHLVADDFEEALIGPAPVPKLPAPSEPVEESTPCQTIPVQHNQNQGDDT